MKLYSENKDYKLYQGNMLDMLETIELNSIDSIITDPPYELNFMGKGWDNSGIAFQKETWQKCYEVLKPGGYLLAFGGSRTFHRIACAIEDAGFEIRDTIMWLYGSGFPKSMDISKQLDKHERRNYVEMAMKLGIQPKSNASWRDWTIGEHSPSDKYWEEFKKSIPKEEWEKIEREVIGQREKLESYQYKNNNVYQTNGDKEKITLDITIPSTDLAKQWQGWGTALKPSFEPIIVARKPFKSSLVDNVIEYGVGGINIDECRVGNETISIHNAPKGTFAGGEYGRGSDIESYRDSTGRFPANTILTYDETDFDEVCGGFPITKGDSRTSKPTYDKSIWGNAKSVESNCLYNDSGSASRYFYCAKASKKDRDEGLDEFEEKNMRIEQKRGIHSAGCEYIENGKLKQNPHLQSSCKRNIHPTVKPTELMQYLVRLVSPDGAIILDCFNGSGSTGKAVMYENRERNKNYKYIGIELTEEYLPIAKARIEYVCKLNEEELKEMQLSIFDMMEK